MPDSLNTHQKPKLSRFAFWDTDLSKIDFDRYNEFAIIRVMERGTEQDIDEIIRYYGRSVIISTLISANRLMPRAIAAAKKHFSLTDNDFSCCIHKLPVRNYSKF